MKIVNRSVFCKEKKKVEVKPKKELNKGKFYYNARKLPEKLESVYIRFCVGGYVDGKPMMLMVDLHGTICNCSPNPDSSTPYTEIPEDRIALVLEKQ